MSQPDTMRTETQTSPASLILHHLGIRGVEEGKWEIGTYLGAGTVCVNYSLNGKSYHRSDYGGILPRWLRIGLAIRSINKEVSKWQAHQSA